MTRWLRWPDLTVFAVLAVGVALGLAGCSRSPESTSIPTTTAPVSVGQTATGFTLKDANGQAYTLNPADGKAHVLLF